jgi:putative flippase GtrA
MIAVRTINMVRTGVTQECGKVVRFGVSGLLATGLHVGVATALIMYLNQSQAFANAVAFVCATCGSCLLHTLWSFSSTLHPRNVARFLVVSMGGLMLSAVVAHLSQEGGASPWVGVALVQAIVPPYTFIAHRFWTYR